MSGGSSSGPPVPDTRQPALSAREREVLGLLADGLSGAAIAERLVLSPETVRTHVRNAMAKLGASTRSQAIAIALERKELGPREAELEAGTPSPQAPRTPAASAAAARRSLASGTGDSTLQALLIGLTSLPDIEGGAFLIADEEGLSLRRAAYVPPPSGDNPEVPAMVPLGEGPIGRVALERSASVVQLNDALGRPRASAQATTIASPIVAAGRMMGALCLITRPSRPARETEALLVQAFANRVGEVLLVGGDGTARRLGQTLDRFRVSWAVVASQS